GSLRQQLLGGHGLLSAGVLAGTKYTGQTTGRKRSPGVPGGVLQYSQSPQLCPKLYRPPSLRGHCEWGSAAFDSRTAYLDWLRSLAADPVRAETAFLIPL